MNYNLALDELDHFLDGETPQLPTEIEQLSRRDASLLQRIDEEFTAGFRIMARRGPSATVFGRRACGREPRSMSLVFRSAGNWHGWG
jgi:hypothetical protein